MNWYRKAKMADSAYHYEDEEPMPVKCMYCGRWATHPVDAGGPRDEYRWKLKNELDEEEAQVAEWADRNHKASHGICPLCHGLMETIGMMHPEKITEMSLQMESI